MKKALIPTVAAALAAASLAGAAHAQTSFTPGDFYVRGDAGVNFQDQIDGGLKAKGKTGWTVDLAAGRQFGSNFRGEGELLYSDADGKSGTPGRIKTTAALVNGYYDIDTGTKLRPFVGLGVGYGSVKLDGANIPNSDDDGFAWQAQAGVSYPVSDRVNAQIAYHYLSIPNVKLGDPLHRIDGDYRDQAVTVGVAYKFGR